MDFTSLLSGAQKYTGQVGGILGNLGSISGAVSSLFGSKKAERRAMANQVNLMKLSTDLQKELASYQNDINVQNWNMQNEYNSPTAQMQRYADAGLNTNLIYGGNGSVAGNAESVGSASGGSPNVSADMSVMSGLARRQMDLQNFAQLRQNAMVDSQIDLNHAQANKLNAEANEVAPNALSDRNYKLSLVGLTNRQASKVDVDTRQASSYLDYFDRTKGIRIQQDVSNLGLTKQQTELFSAQTATALYRLNEVLPLEVSTMKFTLEKFLPAQVSELMTRAHLNKASAASAAANALYLGALKLSVERESNFKSSLYGSKVYRDSIIRQAYAEGMNQVKQSKYWQYRGVNELKGLPYIFTLTNSQSGSVSLTGISHSSSSQTPVYPGSGGIFSLDGSYTPFNRY